MAAESGSRRHTIRILPSKRTTHSRTY
jgi:hypothetical protein